MHKFIYNISVYFLIFLLLLFISFWPEQENHATYNACSEMAADYDHLKQ
jgi:hypothetical protein